MDYREITKHLGQRLVQICRDNNLLSPYPLINDIGGNGELLQELLNFSDGSIGFYININENIQHPRISFLQGSFLEENSIPSIGDVYILNHILYDQDDEICIRILRNIKNKKSFGSKIWIIEFPFEERTQQEYISLVNESEMKLETIIPLGLLELSLIIIS